MSPISDNENDFEALRRLLALKRHEVPPPGYFENFSDNIIARIQAGDQARDLPWLLRFLQAFEARPAYPVAFASSLCMVLLFGIVSVQQSPGVAGSFGTLGQNSFASAFPAASSEQDNGQLMAVASTNPPVNFSGNSSLFNSSPNPYIHEAGSGYSLMGN
jgi:hypothetical protein